MRRSWGVFLLLCAASAAGAADPAEPADSITAAKKDLAAIKALGSPSDAGATLPSLDLKTISPGPDCGHAEALPAARTPEVDPSDPSAKKEKGATGNWLVDAMDKKADRKASPGDRESLARDELDPVRESERSSDRADGTRDNAERAVSGEASAHAYNPLDAYMSGWVSARDHDLLVPVSHAGVSELAEGSKPKADGALPLALGESDFSAEALLSGPEPARWSAPLEESNPYLAALNQEPAVTVKAFVSPEIPDLGLGLRPATPSQASDAGSIEAPKSLIPDFAQPADDDKYFKQMKRF
jgi:hypothetical protein